MKIGITGHRNIYNSDAIRMQLTALLTKHKGKNLIAYSSLATGADTIFAQEVIKLGGKLIPVFPFAKEEYLKDFTDDADKIVFKDILGQAVEPIIVTQIVPKNEDERLNAYLKAGKFIAKNTNYLIAVWDGQDAQGKGGTGDIVDYYWKKRWMKIFGKWKFEHIIAARTCWKYEFAKRDIPAIPAKTKYVRYWQLTILFSIVSAFIFALNISVQFSPFWCAILYTLEALAIAFTLIRIFSLSRGSLKSKWVSLRREAEMLRVWERFSEAGIPIALNTNSQKILKSITCDFISFNADDPKPTIDSIKVKSEVSQLINEQIDYHKNVRTKNNQQALEKLEFIQKILIIIFSIAVLMHLIIAWSEYLCHECKDKVQIPHLFENGVLFISLFIVPLLAALEGYLFFKEYRKNIMDSKLIIQFFEEMHEKLSSAKSDNEILHHTNTIQIAMEQENIYWYTTAESKVSPSL